MNKSRKLYSRTSSRNRQTSQNSRSRKARGIKKTACENTFCKKYLENILDERKKLITILESMPNKTKEQIKHIKTMKTEKDKQRMLKIEKEVCMNQYCNIDCKDTIFEAGKTLPAKFLKKYKSNPTALSMFRDTRKQLFGQKTNILKNNFYEKVKNISKLKKQGAISGCVQY